MSFSRSLDPISPIIRLSNGDRYQFPLRSKFKHEWDKDIQPRTLIIPRGKDVSKLHGQRLIVTATFKPMPNVEKDTGGGFAAYDGVKGLAEISDAFTVEYAPWGTTYHDMLVVSNFSWEKTKRNDYEDGILMMESVLLYAAVTDIAEGGL